jgi:hypothetical protein
VSDVLACIVLPHHEKFQTRGRDGLVEVPPALDPYVMWGADCMELQVQILQKTTFGGVLVGSAQKGLSSLR